MFYDSHFVIEVLHQVDLLSDTFSNTTVPKVTFDQCIIYMNLTRCLIDTNDHGFNEPVQMWFGGLGFISILLFSKLTNAHVCLHSTALL